MNFLFAFLFTLSVCIACAFTEHQATPVSFCDDCCDRNLYPNSEKCFVQCCANYGNVGGTCQNGLGYCWEFVNNNGPNYGNGPMNSPNYGGPQNSPNYGGPQNSPNYGGPQNSPNYGGPQNSPNYGGNGPINSPNYGGPGNSPNYANGGRPGPY